MSLCSVCADRSILYKSKLPFVLVFNKTDVQSPQFAMDWMQDFEKFQQALAAGNATDPSEQARGGGDSASFRARGEEPSYMNSLMNSMSLVLDEFYKNLRAVGVSSMTGEGMDNFLDAVQAARQEYIDDYRPQLQKMLAEKQANLEKSKQQQMERLKKDMEKAKSADSGLAGARAHAKTEAATEDATEPRYPGDGELIDPDEDEQKPEPDLPREKAGWKEDGTFWPRAS